MPVETLIKIRRGADTSWTAANPTLSLGEPGFDTTNNQIRVGDGSSAWSALDYIGSDKADLSVVNEIDANVDDLITLSGVAENSTDLGTFTGSTIADSETVKGALQDLETEVETKAATSVVNEIDANVDDLITLSGVAENSTDLGTFTGGIITDSSDIKTALQELETEVESLESATDLDIAGDTGTGGILLDSETLTIAGTANEIETSMAANTLTVGLPASITVASNITVGGTVDGRDVLDDGQAGDNLITLSGVARDATDLGTFTGSIITDSSTVKAALQELETEVETKAATSVVNEIDANVDDLITLSGVAENSTDLGTFTGGIITDSSTVKAALQELETEVESLESATDLDIAGDTGTGGILLASETLTIAGTANEIETSMATNTLTVGLPASITVASNITVGGTVDGRDVLDDGQAGDNLITLSGVARDATDLGTFTGSTIADSETVKGALQDLETEVETKAATSVVNEIDANVDDLITLSGVAENSTDLGTFTGSTIADSETVKGALQDLETEVETKAATSVVNEIDANVDDLITLSGVAENSTDLGTFTGSVITDSSTVKAALQELETEVETISSAQGDLAVAGDSGTGSITLVSETLTISGTANEIETSMATNTLTVGLPDSITVTDNITVGGYIAGPATFTIDPAAVGDDTGTVVIAGNLTVNGTTTTINSTTLTVDDKNIELGSVASPTDVTANGGGITLLGATNKTLIWESATTNWNSSEHFNLASGKEYQIADTSVLSATTLGSGVVNSSLTTVGTIGTGTWEGTTIGVAYGGTGLSSYTAGDLVYASGATTISKLAIGSANYFLKVNSGGTAPEWSNEIDGGTP